MGLPQLGRQAANPRFRLTSTFVGVFLDAILLGVVLLQTFNFVSRFPHHRPWTRATIIILLALNLTQTVCNGIGMANVLDLLYSARPYTSITRAPTTLTSHLCGPFLMGIPHVILSLQCIRIVKSLSTWKKGYIRLFASLLWIGTVVCFLSGMLGMVAQFVQAKPEARRAAGVASVDWFAFWMSVNLTISAFMDIVLASTMSFQLSKSKSSFQSSNHIVERLTLVLLRNGALLAGVQLSACVVYLTSKFSYTMAFVLINILGKLYTITALLAISTPLNAQSEASLQTPGAQYAANMLSSNDPTCSGPSLPESRTGSLVERVEKVWRMGSSRRGGRSRETTGGSGVKVNGGMNDEEGGISFDEMFDQKTGFSTKITPPPSTYQPNLAYHLNDGFSSGDSSPAASPFASPTTQTINLRYILNSSDMEGIVSPRGTQAPLPKLYPL